MYIIIPWEADNLWTNAAKVSNKSLLPNKIWLRNICTQKAISSEFAVDTVPTDQMNNKVTTSTFNSKAMNRLRRKGCDEFFCNYLQQQRWPRKEWEKEEEKKQGQKIR